MTEHGILVETRPDKGLLGGMIGLPGTDWSEVGPTEDEIKTAAPARAMWREIGEARHTFTHFHLELEVWTIVARNTGELTGWWCKTALLDQEALPTVKRKVLKVVLPAFTPQRQ